MGGSKPKAIKSPFEQMQTNTYEYKSPSETPEAKAFLNEPLDFGKEINVDPGVGRRTDLAVQGIRNRYASAFNMAIPAWIRQANEEKEVRDAEAEGAYERQAAEYANQMGNNQIAAQRTAANLDRRRLLLPQLTQTGGSSSGFNTQVMPGSPGFFSSLGQGLGGSLGSAFGSFAAGKIPGGFI